MLPSNLLIINYHKIETKSDIGITTRHPNDFKDDLEELDAQGYKTVNFYDLEANKNIPEKPVIITFDDAYASFYDTAFAILKDRGMTAVVFVPVNYVGKANGWDVQFFNKKYMHMTFPQLQEISKNNIEVGSHTLNHTYLNALNKSDLECELNESKQILENCIDKPVISVSYPFGKCNKTVVEIAKKYYKFGVRLLPQYLKNMPEKEHSLTRINIYRGDSRKVFIQKLKFRKQPFLGFKNRLIQQGSWATILLKKMQGTK